MGGGGVEVVDAGEGFEEVEGDVRGLDVMVAWEEVAGESITAVDVTLVTVESGDAGIFFRRLSTDTICLR